MYCTGTTSTFTKKIEHEFDRFNRFLYNNFNKLKIR